MLSGALVVVDLTASAVQMIALNAETKRIAAWHTQQQHALAFAPAPTSNIVEASLR